jgi:hypothetical protein
MSDSAKRHSKPPDEDEIDEIVAGQVHDDAAWEPPVEVRRTGEAHVELSAELAARALFIARAHRARTLDQWLERIIRERVELEESAFASAKRELSSRRPA